MQKFELESGVYRNYWESDGLEQIWFQLKNSNIKIEFLALYPNTFQINYIDGEHGKVKTLHNCQNAAVINAISYNNSKGLCTIAIIRSQDEYKVLTYFINHSDKTISKKERTFDKVPYVLVTDPENDDILYATINDDETINIFSDKGKNILASDDIESEKINVQYGKYSATLTFTQAERTEVDKDGKPVKAFSPIVELRCGSELQQIDYIADITEEKLEDKMKSIKQILARTMLRSSMLNQEKRASKNGTE